MSGVTELKYKGVLTTELNSCRQFLNVRSQCNFISRIVSYDCTDKAEIRLEIMEWDHESHDPLGAQAKTRKLRKSFYRSSADQWRITIPEVPNTKVMVVENGSMKKLYDAAGKIITASIMPSLFNIRKNVAGLVVGVDTLVARFPGRQRSDGKTGRWAYTTRDYKEMYSEVPGDFRCNTGNYNKLNKLNEPSLPETKNMSTKLKVLSTYPDTMSNGDNMGTIN